MMKARIFFTAGDQIDWAVDEDLSHVKEVLVEKVEFSSFEDAEIIFAAWWAPLMDYGFEQLRGKSVVCFMHGDPERFLELPAHAEVFEKVDLWLTRSKKATTAMRSFGFNAMYVPYMENTVKFGVLAPSDPELNAVAQVCGRNESRYLIGNFMRDTEGHDLKRPKLVKGPDIFVEIIAESCRRNLPVAAVIAGPRRHWIKDQLRQRNLPFFFIGEETSEDDLLLNTLRRSTINALYNLVNLTVISSRSEGGPLALCEAPISGCKVISTDVGMARDVLPDAAIYQSVKEAVDIIEEDITSNSLREALTKTITNLHVNHSSKSVQEALLSALSTLKSPCGQSVESQFHGYLGRISSKVLRRMRRLKTSTRVQFYLTSYAAKSTGNYPGQIVARTLREEGCKQVFVLKRRPTLVILNALEDLDGDTIFQKQPKIVLVDRPENSEQWKRIVKNLRSLMCEYNIKATVIPSVDMLRDFAKIGVRIRFPIVVPPFGKRKSNNCINSNTEFSMVLLGPKETEFGSVCALETNVENAKSIGADEGENGFQHIKTVDFSHPKTWMQSMSECSIYVEFGGSEEAQERLRFAKHIGVPSLFRDTKCSRNCVGFGGVPFSKESDLGAGLQEVIRLYPLFSAQENEVRSSFSVLVDLVKSIANRG